MKIHTRTWHETVMKNDESHLWIIIFEFFHCVAVPRAWLGTFGRRRQIQISIKITKGKHEPNENYFETLSHLYRLPLSSIQIYSNNFVEWCLSIEIQKMFHFHDYHMRSHTFVYLISFFARDIVNDISSSCRSQCTMRQTDVFIRISMSFNMANLSRSFTSAFVKCQWWPQEIEQTNFDRT